MSRTTRITFSLVKAYHSSMIKYRSSVNVFIVLTACTSTLLLAIFAHRLAGDRGGILPYSGVIVLGIGDAMVSGPS